ncbi:glycine zipper domain-containing protein [Novosphingobium sp.]|jgi:outer membrane lipoprotein SlyB|uniref:glycine zipper domain-containing protein n=1 Tax=Novosphingobium sp. TaxID=1874826 RepID=UPI0031DFE569
MKSLLPALAAAVLILPALAADADARPVPRRQVYKSCRHSSGTTGLVAGGVAGAVVGDKVIGGGLAGPLVGAAAGALGGRAIDRSMTAKKRCRYYRR